jgi:hypothetical protein
MKVETAIIQGSRAKGPGDAGEKPQSDDRNLETL